MDLKHCLQFLSIISEINMLLVEDYQSFCCHYHFYSHIMFLGKSHCSETYLFQIAMIRFYESENKSV